MRRLLIAAVMCVLLFIQPLQAQQPSPPPENVTMAWLQPGMLLVRWQQKSAADKTSVMRCTRKNENECVVYTEIFNRFGGVRYAVIAAQPNDPIRLAEYKLSAPSWALLHWTASVYAPSYEVQVPVVIQK